MVIPKLPRRIRYAMVGGGQGAFIGAVHRTAANMDGYWELVAGAFSSTPEKSHASGLELGLPEARCYGTWEELIEQERILPPDIRAEVIVIVTPNHLHAPVAIAALNAGFHVLSDKPATRTVEEARELEQTLEAAWTKNHRLQYGITYNYTGNPLMHQARILIQQGVLGDILSVDGEYRQGWLVKPIEQGADAVKQAVWRTDPALAGAGALGDIGSHLYQLSRFLVPEVRAAELFADVAHMTPGRRIDDYANVILRYENGARGNFRISQVAIGHENDLRIEINGTMASLWWHQQEPNTLYVSHESGNTELIRAGAGMPGINPLASQLHRTPGGHPEGYLEAFANTYRNFALLVADANSVQEIGIKPYVPSIIDAVDGMIFIDTCLESAEHGAWTKLPRY